MAAQREELKLIAQKYDLLQQRHNKLESSFNQLSAERDYELKFRGEGEANRRDTFKVTKL
jgi:hypothetical protein